MSQASVAQKINDVDQPFNTWQQTAVHECSMQIEAMPERPDSMC